MNIVGFSFSRINADRKKAVVGKISITNNISLIGVSEAKFGLSPDRGAVRVGFSFKTIYQPDMATITLEGEVLCLLDQKGAKDMIEGWEKSRQLPKDSAAAVMNHALERCNIQALIIAKDLNLPSPLPLPKVRVGDAKPAPKAEAPKAAKKK